MVSLKPGSEEVPITSHSLAVDVPLWVPPPTLGLHRSPRVPSLSQHLDVQVPIASPCLGLWKPHRVTLPCPSQPGLVPSHLPHSEQAPQTSFFFSRVPKGK